MDITHREGCIIVFLHQWYLRWCPAVHLGLPQTTIRQPGQGKSCSSLGKAPGYTTHFLCNRKHLSQSYPTFLQVPPQCSPGVREQTSPTFWRLPWLASTTGCSAQPLKHLHNGGEIEKDLTIIKKWDTKYIFFPMKTSGKFYHCIHNFGKNKQI